MTRTSKKKQPVDPVAQLQLLNEELKAKGYEVVIRKIPTKDVVAFDFGLVFTKDSRDVGLYVDDVLRDALIVLSNEHGQVFVKVNWFSPDVMVVTPQENPDPLQSIEDTDTAASLDTSTSLPEALREPIDPLRLL